MVGYLTETPVLKADQKATDGGVVNRGGQTREIEILESLKITSGNLDVRMVNRNLQSQSDQRVYDGGTVYRGLGLRSGQSGTSNGIANKSSGFWLDVEAVMLN